MTLRNVITGATIFFVGSLGGITLMLGLVGLAERGNGALFILPLVAVPLVLILFAIDLAAALRQGRTGFGRSLLAAGLTWPASALILPTLLG